MKHFKLILGVSLLSVIMAALAVEQPAPQTFKIEVDLSGAEAKMRCVTGCAWITTSFSCGSAQSCSFELDQNGVKGLIR